jgi:hypothetical protein
LHFTVSNFKRFLANKRFDFKQARIVKQPNKPDLAAIRQQKISEQAALRQKTIFDNYRCVMHLYYTARRLTEFSGANRPPIPIDAGHPFRSKPATLPRISKLID